MKKVLLTLAALTAVSIANAQQTYNYFDPADCDADGWLWFDTQEKLEKYCGFENEGKKLSFYQLLGRIQTENLKSLRLMAISKDIMRKVNKEKRAPGRERFPSVPMMVSFLMEETTLLEGVLCFSSLISRNILLRYPLKMILSVWDCTDQRE